MKYASQQNKIQPLLRKIFFVNGIELNKQLGVENDMNNALIEKIIRDNKY